MVVFPNAKINLGLNILSRRPDGYHEIESLMLPISWSDILEIVPAKGTGTTLTVTGREVDCPADKNLVMKAYRRMAQEVTLPAVDIYLHKIVPDGAGLGGGSSDAAFTLLALNEMFSLGFTKEQLADMAADLGADCPFFIYNRPMLASGTGTTLRDAQNLPASNRKLMIAVVKPNEYVSTKEAYSGVEPRRPEVGLSEALAASDLRNIRNQFEETVLPAHPQIGAAKERLTDLGAIYASMSGSGSAVYGFFDAEKISADKLSEIIKANFKELEIHVSAI